LNISSISNLPVLQSQRLDAPSDPDDSGARSILLVLGMHRSGTSALTGVLQKLGVELGEELLPPTRDNPRGHFENARAVAAHEALFAALGRTWQDPRALPPSWRESLPGDVAHEALTQLLRDMLASADSVAVKDPRTSRVVDLWKDVARVSRAEMGAILMIRHPGEVAASLHRRDGLSRVRANLLWMTYLLEAERGTRDLPRAFVSYQSLLADWRSTLTRMRDDGLGHMVPEATATTSAEIDAFLDASLRRHGNGTDVGGASPFETLAIELYGLALRCAAGQAQDSAAAFDDIARRLAPLAAHYFEAPLQLEQEIQWQRLEQARIDGSLQLAAMRELWRPAYPARPPGAARLYYRLDDVGFDESHAVSADPETDGTRRTVIFRLPEDARFDHLRLDPDSAPGVYAIESVTIGGVAVADFADRLRGVQELSMPTSRRGDLIRFASLGDDPYFVFEAQGLGGLDAVTPLDVEVCFRAETVLSEIGAQFDDYRAVLQSHGRDLEHRQQELGRRQQELDAAIREIEKHQASIDAGLKLLPAVAARQERIEATLGAELVAIREHQSVLLTWAQRRTLRYWWRRLTGNRT